MPRAIVGPIWTTFEGLDPAQRLKLDDAFAVQIPGLMFNPTTRRLILSKRWDGKKHLFTKASSELPTGLLSKALPLVPGCAIDFQMPPEEYARWQTAKQLAHTVEVFGKTFRPDQRGAIISAVDNRRGIIKCATNYGKTLVGAGIAKALSMPTLYVIHRASLLDEASTRLEEYLEMPVGKYGDSFHSDGALLTVGIDKSIVIKMKKDKTWASRFGCVIFDEAQHLCSSTQQKIAKACINAHFRYAMSGSFPKDRLKVLDIMAVTDSTLLYEVTNEELIEQGLSATPHIHIKPVKYQDEQQTLWRMDWENAYDHFIAHNEAYHQLNAEDAAHWVGQGKPTMVAVERIEHGQSICKKLEKMGIESVLVEGKMSTPMRKALMKKFKQGLLPVIVSTIVLSEGIDVPEIGALLLTQGGKSPIRFLQWIGRGLRKKQSGENVVYVQDYDIRGNKYMERHSKARQKICQEQNFIITIMPEHNI